MVICECCIQALFRCERGICLGKDLKGRELGKGISQRKDGFYVGGLVLKNGKRRQKLFHKLQECRQWLADARYQDEHTNLDLPDKLTVEAWYDYWISMKERTVRPNTVRNYRERYQKNVRPVIGNILLTDVKPIHCQRIMNQMADDGYATSTIYQARIALFNMLNYAYENDVIMKNPCNKTVEFDIGKSPKKKIPLTVEEQKKFVEGIEGNTYEYQFKFILQTGLRTGELVGLKWSDIDFGRKTLTISRSVEYRYSVGEWRIGPPKSKAGYRTIPLTDEAIKLLKLQKKKNAGFKVIPMEWSDTVFLCKKGMPVKNSTYDTMLYKLADKIGIRRFCMHLLRHTFATRCIEGGMRPKTLQNLMGHSNIGITMNLYVHTTEDEKHKEIEKIADILNVV